MWAVLRPLFRGEYPAVAAMSAASFLAGLTEATLLGVLANLALTIGGGAPAGQDLGVLGVFGKDVPQLFAMALGLTALRLLLQYTSAALTSRTTARLTQRIREGTFRDYVEASWELQASETEAAVQDLLLRHVGKAQAAVVAVANAITTLVMLVALVGSAFIVDPVAAALIILSGGLLFLALRPLTTIAKRLADQQLKLGLEYSAQAREAIDLSMEIRAFGVSDPVSERLRVATLAEVEPSAKAQLLGRMVAALYSLAAVVILLAGLFVVYQVQERPLASLGAIVIILIRALNQSQSLQGNYHSLSESVPFVARLDAERARFRASIPPSGDRHLEGFDDLRFDHVSYSYTGDALALRDVSFRVPAGEAVGIVGPSGSGKSTLIQLLLRLRHPTAGRFLVGGIDASEFGEASRFDQIAFVPQDCHVFNATIGDNIAFFRSGVTRDQVVEAAQRAHVHDEIMAMPQGYDTVLGSRGGALSGGQRQRVAIARALVRRPSILVLDEPTSALDMRSEALVHETLSELRGSVTLFVIAHRLSTLNTCDRIMVFHQGQLQAFDDRDALEAGNAFYRQAIQLSQVRH